ncbi:MAG: hypothetical protein JNJ57_14915 [Saprospiraceae bacterium]|nr:hypothetical protein [Saprospiraceae bacterium]
MRFVLFSLILLVCSCEQAPKETRADRIAKAVCDCATPLLNLNKQAAESPQGIDFEKIQAEFEKSKICIADQRMKPEDLPEVQKSIVVKCPQLSGEVELLNELLGLQ